MKSVLALLALTTAIGTSVAGVLMAAPIAAPDMAPAAASATVAPGALFASSPAVTAPQPAQLVTTPDGKVMLAEDDGDEDEGWIFGRKERREGGEHDDDDDDEGGCRPGTQGCAQAPAAAGTVAPPANGLFTNGSAAPVQSN